MSELSFEVNFNFFFLASDYDFKLTYRTLCTTLKNGGPGVKERPLVLGTFANNLLIEEKERVQHFLKSQGLMTGNHWTKK